MKYFWLSLCLICAPVSSVLSSDGYLHEKITLIDSELCYCRYLIYESKHNHIDKMTALETIDDILDVVFIQLKELNAE